MDENDPKKETAPVIVIVERRRQREGELSSADVMKIVRKRAAKGGRRNPHGA